MSYCVCGKDSWFVDGDTDVIRCEWCNSALPETVIRREIFDKQVYLFTEHNMFMGRRVAKILMELTPVDWPDDLPLDFTMSTK